MVEPFADKIVHIAVSPFWQLLICVMDLNGVSETKWDSPSRLTVKKLPQDALVVSVGCYCFRFRRQMESLEESQTTQIKTAHIYRYYIDPVSLFELGYGNFLNLSF